MLKLKHFHEPTKAAQALSTQNHPLPLATHPQATILSAYKSDPALVIGDEDKGPYIELVQKFVQVFPLYLMEKTERTYGPTQYTGSW